VLQKKTVGDYETKRHPEGTSGEDLPIKLEGIRRGTLGPPADWPPTSRKPRKEDPRCAPSGKKTSVQNSSRMAGDLLVRLGEVSDIKSVRGALREQNEEELEK